MIYLAFRRRDLGYSQTELGKRAGLRLEVVSEIERGRVNPTEEELERLARALAVGPPARLLQRVTDPFELSLPEPSDAAGR